MANYLLAAKITVTISLLYQIFVHEILKHTKRQALEPTNRASSHLIKHITVAEGCKSMITVKVSLSD